MNGANGGQFLYLDKFVGLYKSGVAYLGQYALRAGRVRADNMDCQSEAGDLRLA